ncbi:ABC transporter permease [Nocardiopsis halophila]|uniref:ABC transporter permease n=1 Tax=Nocardiopsis halophila TaxID=141692 RepID=UPI000377456E|nr:ABC transporter permease [Nocardiopsis halophila]
MPSIVRSELTKILTLRSVWIATGAIIALNLFFQYQNFPFVIETVANVRGDGLSEVDGRLVDAETELRQTLGVSVFNPGLLFPILGAVIAGAEFRAGQIGLSVVAVPDRIRLVIGKVVAATAFVLGLGIVCILIATASTYIAVRNWNPGMLWSGAMLAVDARLLLFIGTSALIGVGITLISRRTLAGVVATVVLIMLTMAQLVAAVSPAVDAFLPFSAARNLLLQGRDAGAPLTGTAVHGGAVLLGWAVVATVSAALVIDRRDAR